MSLADVPLLILAGGRATRLKHLSAETAKYLQPITAQKRFADFHLEWVARNGFKRVLLSIGYLGDQVRQYCGNGENFGLQIDYIDDGPTPLGTGGATVKTLSHPFESLAVTYGDTILDFDCAQFFASFQKSGLNAGMTLLKDPVGHPCNAKLEGLFAIYDKFRANPNQTYVDYGFLLLSRRAILSFPKDKSFDLAEPLGKLSAEKQLFGFQVYEHFLEIGTPEALQKFREAFSGDKIINLKQ